MARPARLPVEIARRIEAGIRLGRGQLRLPSGDRARCRKPYFCDLLDYFSTQIGRGVTLVRRSPGEDRHVIKEIHGEHVAIFEAIAALDPEHAREAVRVHLTRTAAPRGLGLGVSATP